MVGALFGLRKSLGWRFRRVVFVAGSPRSGTTWLGELAATTAGAALNFEPIHPQQTPGAEASGMAWRTYVPPGSDRPELARVMDAVFDGAIGNVRAPVGPARVRRTLTASVLVVKDIRSNRMLAWIDERPRLDASLLLVRHPCAVAASQLEMGNRLGLSWANPQRPTPDRTLADVFGAVPAELYEPREDLLRSLETAAGILAVSWSLDTYIPLVVHPSSRPVVTYESLAGNPAAIEQALTELGLTVTEATHAAIGRPSAMASKTFTAADTDKQLSKWTHALSQHEVDEVLAVAHSFGLDFYGRDVLPDASRFATFRP